LAGCAESTANSEVPDPIPDFPGLPGKNSNLESPSSSKLPSCQTHFLRNNKEITIICSDELPKSTPPNSLGVQGKKFLNSLSNFLLNDKRN